MWINDGERGHDVKSVEFTSDRVVGGGGVTESDGRTLLMSIYHPTFITSSIFSQTTGGKDGGSTTA